MCTYTFSLISSTKTEHLLNDSVVLEGLGAPGLYRGCGFWKAFLEEEALQLGLSGGDPEYSR